MYNEIPLETISINMYNSVKISKSTSRCNQKFVGYRKDYPVALKGILSPTEFDSIIEALNSTVRSRNDMWTLVMPVLQLISLVLLLVGVATQSEKLLNIAMCISVSIFGTVVIFNYILHWLRIRKFDKTGRALNSQYATKNVRFIFKKKFFSFKGKSFRISFHVEYPNPDHYVPYVFQQTSESQNSTPPIHPSDIISQDHPLLKDEKVPFPKDIYKS
ncbi:hypothetical protein CYY_010537 [Polysphondylium violaceum]|uniref:Transmembrane protein n=1 Tax=Polysphondylium violaceum TaxID=133409 RepID=A0A8J4PJR0_9MYCE|nr:hypothetical protein CYY_010537 [Polysphondylium violaceum]